MSVVYGTYLNKRAKNAVESRLDKLGVKHHFIEAENKVVISDENDNDIEITEFNYPHSLSDELVELNEFMDNKFEVNFEVEWSGTFSIILDK